MTRSVEDGLSNGRYDAFPVTGQHIAGHGLTKREYFAAAALQGLLAHHNDLTYEAIVRDSLVYADGLLQELAK